MRTALSATDVRRAVTRLAHELAETGTDPDDLVVLGIPTRGVPLAARLAGELAAITGETVPHGSLDVTMYRDDLSRTPTRSPAETSVPVAVTDRVVVLVDDVLFSGRTVRAALDALRDLGRPEAVRLVTLVDRGHRRLPVRPDHVGRNLPTSLAERVRVRLVEVDGSDGVDVVEPGAGDRGPTAAAAGSDPAVAR